MSVRTSSTPATGPRPDHGIARRVVLFFAANPLFVPWYLYVFTAITLFTAVLASTKNPTAIEWLSDFLSFYTLFGTAILILPYLDAVVYRTAQRVGLTIFPENWISRVGHFLYRRLYSVLWYLAFYTIFSTSTILLVWGAYGPTYIGYIYMVFFGGSQASRDGLNTALAEISAVLPYVPVLNSNLFNHTAILFALALSGWFCHYYIVANRVSHRVPYTHRFLLLCVAITTFVLSLHTEPTLPSLVDSDCWAFGIL